MLIPLAYVFAKRTAFFKDHVAKYVLFHYGGAEEILPYAFGPRDALEYPARCVSECVTANGRALDLGCAVGRSAFELARSCEEVVGVDFSRRFIDAANALKTGELAYRRTDEGDRGQGSRGR